MRRLIEAIPPQMHTRLVIHDHFDLISRYRLGGLHLNRRCPVAPHGYSGGLSRSCHSIDEVMAGGTMDYVTLSPVFDSISKSGYMAAYSHEELLRLSGAPTKVIALGGVNPERIDFLKRYNFTGFCDARRSAVGRERRPDDRFYLPDSIRNYKQEIYATVHNPSLRQILDSRRSADGARRRL